MINFNENIFFKEKGYFIFKKFLTDDQINIFLNQTKNVVIKSETGEWPFLSVYNDYVHFRNKINIFGINYPLNSFFDTKLFDIFNIYNYSSEILKFTGWESLRTTLIRLHVFNKNYNYYGAWHRDDINYPSPNSIQSVLYLSNEKGFRIVPKDKIQKLPKYNIKISGESKNPIYETKELPNILYEEIEANAGDLLFFESGLLHQGICKGNRLHFHLRHERSNEILKSDNKLNFVNVYLPNYPFEKIEKIYPKYLIKRDFSNKVKRALRLAQYFLPRLKCLINNISRKSLFKENIFKNTYWQ